mmetsp:Transcript_55445/g.61882  ORF Transcript_55445/g.61882 Transcript_55445/m.61882 type:complete len:96 (-) Transcript_55445:3079-3366(-)
MGSMRPKNNNKNRISITDHQKQAVVLLFLSAIIYTACQFDSTLNLVVPSEEKLEGPKPGKKVTMISLLGERNSGTRWTSDHLKECFQHAIEVQSL